MSKVDVDNACNELRHDHAKAEVWLSLAVLTAIVGIGVSITLLPTSPAVLISVILAVAGVGVGYFGGRLDQEFDTDLADLRRMLAAEGAGSAESPRDDEH